MSPLILIPAYNEERTIATIVEDTKRAYPDVLVVDDGSMDRTADLARDAGAEVLRHPWNLGKGAALDTGFTWAAGQGYQHVVTLDADGQHDPKDIGSLLDASSGVDIVIGTRLGDLAAMPTKNKVGNLISTRCINRAARTNVGDSQSGFRFVPVSVWQDLDLTTSGFDTETEMLIQAGRRGYRIGVVRVKTIYTGRENSKFRVFRDSLRIGWVLLRYCIKDLLPGAYPGRRM